MTLDLQKYLENAKKNVFRNASVFDNTYYPEKPIERPEAVQIMERIADFIRLRVVDNIFLVGKPGAGKTLYGKYLQKQVAGIIKSKQIGQNSVRVEYRNCRDYDDPLVILKSMCSLKDKSANDVQTIQRRFFEELNSDMILILDEVDELDQPNYLFYTLTRIPELQTTTNYKVQLILISNNAEWDKDLQPPVRSSLNLTRVIFEEYSKSQVREILEQRLKLGLQDLNIVPDKIINFVLDKTQDNNGDLRIALKYLFLSCKEIEKIGVTKINAEIIEEIYKEAIRQVELERIAKLEENSFLILYAVAKAKNHTVRDIFVEEYMIACREIGLRPLGYTRFNFYLNYLVDQNMIIISKEKKDRTLHNKAVMRMNTAVVLEEFEKRKLLMSSKDSSAYVVR